MMEMSRAKTVFALAIVVGCFAILWPKIFYPMLLSSVAPPQKHHPTPAGFCCGVVFESDASIQFTAELCSWVLKNDMAMELTTLPLERGGRPPERVVTLCREELLKKCNVDINDIVRSDVDGVVDRRRKLQGLRAQNLTQCLKVQFDIDDEWFTTKKSYPQHPVFIPRHMKPERPPHLHPDLMHPALREKGRVLPTRTIEKQAKPGPIPGMRPPMGGPGHIVPPSKTDGTGAMGILMPIYTIGIVVFFLYTIMKIMFKRSEDQKPLIKDFHLDPEQRKFVFAEDYTSGGELSMKEYARRQEVLEERRKSRSKSPQVIPEEEVTSKDVNLEESAPKENIEETSSAEESAENEKPRVEEIKADSDNEAPIIHKMDTGGKELGEWYLDRGFVKDEVGESTESEPEQDPVSDSSQQVLQTALAALRAQKEEEIDQLRRRLEETEKAMERIVAQMENVADKLSAPQPDSPTQKQQTCQEKEDAFEEEQKSPGGEEPEVVEGALSQTDIVTDFSVPEQEPFANVSEDDTSDEIVQDIEEQIIASKVIEQFSQRTADKLISEALGSNTVSETSHDTCVSVPEEQAESMRDRNRRSASRQSSDDAKLTVMGMEVMVGLEGGKKMSRSPTPVKDLLPKPEKPKVDPIADYVPSVFLEAALPPDTHLVVSEAECRAEAVPLEQLDLDELEYETTPVVLSGKMTLSVIGMELVADPAAYEDPALQQEEKTVNRPGILREQQSEEDSDSGSRGHRVRFMAEPEELIIPSSDDLEIEEDYAYDVQLPDDEQIEVFDGTEAVETASPVLVGYRPPTPPIHHESENDPENEFLTYSELEEAGETENVDIVEIPVVSEAPTRLETVELVVLEKDAEDVAKDAAEEPAEEVVEEVEPEEVPEDQHDVSETGQELITVSSTGERDIMEGPVTDVENVLLESSSQETSEETPETLNKNSDQKLHEDSVTQIQLESTSADQEPSFTPSAVEEDLDGIPAVSESSTEVENNASEEDGGKITEVVTEQPLKELQEKSAEDLIPQEQSELVKSVTPDKDLAVTETSTEIETTVLVDDENHAEAIIEQSSEEVEKKLEEDPVPEKPSEARFTDEETAAEFDSAAVSAVSETILEIETAVIEDENGKATEAVVEEPLEVLEEKLEEDSLLLGQPETSSSDQELTLASSIPEKDLADISAASETSNETATSVSVDDNAGKAVEAVVGQQLEEHEETLGEVSVPHGQPESISTDQDSLVAPSVSESDSSGISAVSETAVEISATLTEDDKETTTDLIVEQPLEEIKESLEDSSVPQPQSEATPTDQEFLVASSVAENDSPAISAVSETSAEISTTPTEDDKEHATELTVEQPAEELKVKSSQDDEGKTTEVVAEQPSEELKVESGEDLVSQGQPEAIITDHELFVASSTEKDLVEHSAISETLTKTETTVSEDNREKCVEAVAEQLLEEPEEKSEEVSQEQPVATSTDQELLIASPAAGMVSTDSSVISPEVETIVLEGDEAKSPDIVVEQQLEEQDEKLEENSVTQSETIEIPETEQISPSDAIPEIDVDKETPTQTHEEKEPEEQAEQQLEISAATSADLEVQEPVNEGRLEDNMEPASELDTAVTTDGESFDTDAAEASESNSEHKEIAATILPAQSEGSLTADVLPESTENNATQAAESESLQQLELEIISNDPAEDQFAPVEEALTPELEEQLTPTQEEKALSTKGETCEPGFVHDSVQDTESIGLTSQCVISETLSSSKNEAEVSNGEQRNELESENANEAENNQSNDETTILAEKSAVVTEPETISVSEEKLTFEVIDKADVIALSSDASVVSDNLIAIVSSDTPNTQTECVTEESGAEAQVTDESVQSEEGKGTPLTNSSEMNTEPVSDGQSLGLLHSSETPVVATCPNYTAPDDSQNEHSEQVEQDVTVEDSRTNDGPQLSEITNEVQETEQTPEESVQGENLNAVSDIVSEQSDLQEAEVDGKLSSTEACIDVENAEAAKFRDQSANDEQEEKQEVTNAVPEPDDSATVKPDGGREGTIQVKQEKNDEEQVTEEALNRTEGSAEEESVENDNTGTSESDDQHISDDGVIQEHEAVDYLATCLEVAEKETTNIIGEEVTIAGAADISTSVSVQEYVDLRENESKLPVESTDTETLAETEVSQREVPQGDTEEVPEESKNVSTLPRDGEESSKLMTKEITEEDEPQEEGKQSVANDNVPATEPVILASLQEKPDNQDVTQLEQTDVLKAAVEGDQSKSVDWQDDPVQDTLPVQSESTGIDPKEGQQEELEHLDESGQEEEGKTLPEGATGDKSLTAATTDDSHAGKDKFDTTQQNENTIELETLESPENIGKSDAEQADFLEESEILGASPAPVVDIPENLLMEIEAQILPSESFLTNAPCERSSTAKKISHLHAGDDEEPQSENLSEEEPVEEPMTVNHVRYLRDYQRDREIEEMEHSLETVVVPASVDSLSSERKESVKSESEEPAISPFVIREDYPDEGLDAEEDDTPLTEEDILQARKEIDEIRKLLAHVTCAGTEINLDESSSEGAQSTPGESAKSIEEYRPSNESSPGVKEDLELQIAHAMADEDPAPLTSKGSSPDMEEYEVLGNGSTKVELSSTVLPPHSGVEVIDQPSPLTPTTEASFERIQADDQLQKEPSI